MTASQQLQQHQLFAGVAALSSGMLWFEATRTLVGADVHLGYEEVIGGALPLWSTTPSIDALCDAARQLQAQHVVLLGDVIHGVEMSDGARRRITRALRTLRSRAHLQIIAGNHEGRSRGVAVLGETYERLESNGWVLMHGDRPTNENRAVIGHLHPSIHLGGGQSVPVFLASPQLIVVPAMTPYSIGLDVRSDDCAASLAMWRLRPSDFQVIASVPSGLFALGSLAALRSAQHRSDGASGRGFHRKFLQPDR